jgi:hypothetical protein
MACDKQDTKRSIGNALSSSQQEVSLYFVYAFSKSDVRQHPTHKVYFPLFVFSLGRHWNALSYFVSGRSITVLWFKEIIISGLLALINFLSYRLSCRSQQGSNTPLFTRA